LSFLLLLSFSSLWFISLVLFDFPSCTVFVLSLVLVRCLFCSNLQICFDPDSMTLTSSTLQIRGLDYFRHLYFVISIVGLKIKPFYVINSDAVSLFADSSFLVFSNFEYVMILIDILYPFEWMNIVVFIGKKKKTMLKF
jgi:hypothetical protein